MPAPAASAPTPPDPETDRRWMRAALSLARRALGRAAPNPAVGCVLVREGRVIGRGWTMPGGRPHAERVALDQAAALGGAEAARGATAYVTLEPCAHHGRTPPCADALIAAGVARVVAATGDPDPRVNGKGLARLGAAGIAVETGVLRAEAEALNAGFLMRHRAGRPLVTLKMAASLDGRIALASGESRWITGPEARRRTHLMRAEADALMIGSGTLLADDPALDVRLPGLEDASPAAVALDGRLRMPPHGRLARAARARRVLALHGPDAAPEAAAALRALGVETVPVARGADGRLDLRAALGELAERGFNSVLCEGGGALAAALIRQDLADELAWFHAGAALGADARPAVGPLALAGLALAPRFELVSHERLGADVLTRWRRRESAGGDGE
ncbi:bifunctional diaminohydroxyphosphoribosylaminopyrimidine deaminase/5-amino-6-(5-phosphoribosylamino)uracil reductase RibD [Oceanicella actignis]|uniref:Riboflavin biosynthesis protein RibD n=1 Tax=Oceanicella actignis TaxID=1189325 RepID=A0A1M7S186_9RHOB|nr:bifunctional diaminohydroxyphosphoribosylaminopyrimidine deaminase/5-amino-6-(5-phosphoribosylamino)uracil reductase RibD [Oceanicella actignis]SES92819.1 diaminohydroxyphosphoribosylaminopyrimidine deaminase [Oceanicella actignis]SHN52114.1 diaminohydroxyphosphoribosylaminopyrimidine deaminase / 5-amino-6-(5-phosphoribosylamino)uracil reductase [Oceanicella actignis]